MRMRGVAAAVAGLVGAVTARALDEAGLLPGVHESEAVREAMGPALTVGWLLLAAAASWLAARTRPIVVGPVSALAVAGIPELLCRRDPGAMFEPGALAGALLQSLLLIAILALAVVADRWLVTIPTPAFARPRPHAVVTRSRRPRAGAVVRTAQPRAPPRPPLVRCS